MAPSRQGHPEHLAEGLTTHKVRELYLWGANEPTFTVDITPVLDAKIEALLLSKTRLKSANPYKENSLFSILELSLNFVHVIRFLEGVSKDDANKIKETLEKVGAKVELK